jgi:hypothetical protein
MSQWEYLVRVFSLDKEDEVAIHYVQREYPDRDWKDLPKYDPLMLEAWLNKCGEEGWELVRLEAVDAVGKHGDVGTVYPPAYPAYRSKYLCVFKRSAVNPR